MAAIPTQIPALGTISGLQRKESIYDTEGYNAPAAAPTGNISTFSNYSAFATAGLPLTKQFGRDTNLQGSGVGGLPQAHRFFWYVWRKKWRTLDANLNLAAGVNAYIFEQLNRARQLSYSVFQFSQTRYITCQSDELLSFSDSQFVALQGTTTVPVGAFLMTVTPAVEDRKGKDITVSQQPKILEPLEQFNVQTVTPAQTGGTALVPVVSLYVTDHLDGILIRGITG